MPYENEHSCRLENPDKYDSFKRNNCAQKHDGKCIDVIYGITGSGEDKKSEIQALRYPKDEWSAADAKAHCKDREGKFEAAKESDQMPEGDQERRVYPLTELRVTGVKRKRLTGYAAVFNELSEEMWGFREKIEPGAFKESIRLDDIRMLWNHNPDYVLARTTSGTLELAEDEKGLMFEAQPPDTQWAKDLVVSIERGDVSQNSFGFFVLTDKWETIDGLNIRTLQKVKLTDVSPVTYPAYPQTEIHVRKLMADQGIDPNRWATILVAAGRGLEVSEDDRVFIVEANDKILHHLPNGHTSVGGERKSGHTPWTDDPEIEEQFDKIKEKQGG